MLWPGEQGRNCLRKSRIKSLMEKLFAVLRPRRRYPLAIRYGLTTLIVGVAFLLRLALQEQLKTYPVLLFIPAIFLAAFLFDKGCGFFASVLSALLAEYFFVSPLYSFAVDPEHILPLLLFVGIGAVISMGTETLRHTIDKLAASEKEKALLLGELAHRTKNDFMLISSVLTLQARNENDATARTALETAIARVAVIIKAQARLDIVKEGGTIEVSAYLEALCNGLGNLLQDVRPITVSVEADQIELRASQAVSLGLLVNELVTNSFKYAFAGERGGLVAVRLKREDGKLILTVADDGIGCSSEGKSGEGVELMRLIAGQWGGQLEYGSQDGGCRVSLRLPLR
jgi:two-component system, sensor histidine kinase PdtaS